MTVMLLPSRASFALWRLGHYVGSASGASVGFVFARLRAKGQKFLFTTVVGATMIPSLATLVPIYVLFARHGLVDT